NTQSLNKGVEIDRYAKGLLSKCRYLKSEDLTLEGETFRHDRTTLDGIKDLRLRPIIERLKVIAKSDLTQKSNLALLSNLDFESAKTAFLQHTPVDTNKLKVAIEAKITSAEGLLLK